MIIKYFDIWCFIDSSVICSRKNTPKYLHLLLWYNPKYSYLYCAYRIDGICNSIVFNCLYGKNLHEFATTADNILGEKLISLFFSVPSYPKSEYNSKMNSCNSISMVSLRMTFCGKTFDPINHKS